MTKTRIYRRTTAQRVRPFVMLLLMMVCMSSAWAQEIENGLYYIKIGDIYVWRAISEKTTGQPYLSGLKQNTAFTDPTTGDVYDETNCLWIVKQVASGADTYYTFINVATNQYVVWDYYTHSLGKAVHLETRAMEPTESSDHCFFTYSSSGNSHYIHPDECTTTNCGFNYKNNFSETDYLRVRNNAGGGLIQFFNGTANTITAAPLLPAPTINITNNRVTVTENNGLPEGYHIRYTFSSEGTPADPTASSTVMESDGYLVTEAGTLKVVVERYGVVLTGVAEQEVTPVYCTTPVISFDYSASEVSITCDTEDAIIYYTLDGNTPTAESTLYAGPFTLTENATVKAIATGADFLDSEVASKTISMISRPVISYNGDNIEMTPPGEGYDIYYTMDGSTPTVSGGTKYISPLAPEDVAAGAIEIKAIAVDRENTSRYSEVVTFLLCGETHKLLFLSQTKPNFYLMPGDEGAVKVTSLLHPTMQWYLLNAGTAEGKQYYYIVNGKDNTKRLAYEEGSCKVLDGADDDKFKFQIEESAGVYSIIPNGQTTAISCDGNSLWNFVLPSTIENITTPFTTTDADNAYFYKIGASGYNIMQTDDGVTTSNSAAEADQQAMAWYFERIETETTGNEEDWLTYYHIRSGLTGDYLYMSEENALEVKSTIEGDNQDGYVFTWARTTAADSYYIVSKTALNIESAITLGGYQEWNITAVDYFCAKPVVTIDEEGNVVMKSATKVVEIYYTIDGTDPTVPSTTGQSPTEPTRQYTTEFLLDLGATAITAVAAMKNREKQSETAVMALEQCAAPTGDYSEEHGSLQLSTETPSAEIYYTIDDTDPQLVSSTSHGESPEISFDDNKRYKVFARTARHGRRKSEPYKLEVVYMPTITLAHTPYTYTGEEIQPEIASVTVEGESTAIPATDYEVFGLTDNTDAGTARFSIRQKEGVEYMIFGKADFEIQKAELTAVTLAAEEFEYNQQPQIAEVTSVKAGTLDVDEVNYTVSGNTAQDKGVYTVTVTANDETNYTGTVTKTFEITPKSLGSDEAIGEGISVDIAKEENGAYVITVKDGETVLVEDIDYTKAVDDGKGLVTVSGKGNYTGTAKAQELVFDEVQGSSADAYAAAFVSDNDWQTPAGLTAYIVKGIDQAGGTVTLQAVDYIPTDVPVLLLSTDDSDGFAVLPKTSDTPDITAADKTANLLKVSTTVEHKETAQVYLFYRGEFVLNKAGNLPVGKIYMENPDGGVGGGAARLHISRGNNAGEDTGISQPTTDAPADGYWYTLGGQRLSGQPAKKGLYIRNGKKVAK